MRVGAQVEEAIARLGPATRDQRRRRAADLFREVELPDPSAIGMRYPHELSGGQQQRVMIAMALAGEPDLLVADEATSALDAAVQAEILALLAGLQRRRGLAMLFITHDLGAAATLAHEVAVMSRGEIVETGPTARILAAPQHPDAVRIVAARRRLSGADDARPAGAAVEDGPLLAVDGLSLDYPGREPFRAVDGASFTLGRGRSIGILGPSGSGKSTLAAACAAMHPPAAGEVRLLGHALTARTPRLPPALRRRVQLVFQNATGALNPRLTIGRLLEEPLALGGVPATARAGRVATALAEVGLEPEHASRHPHRLSGGQRQRVCLARALLCDPDLLVCDEVVAALDTTVQVQILDLLQRLQRQRGFGLLFVGHDIDVVRAVSDDILVMSEGRIVDACGRGMLGAAERHEQTRRLMRARLGQEVLATA
jgi:peptide/nickel transport system ATP-binding protein